MFPPKPVLETSLNLTNLLMIYPHDSPMSSWFFSFQCESIGDFPTKKSHDELRILSPCQAAQQVSAAECYPQNSPTGNSQMNYFGAPVEDGAY